MPASSLTAGSGFFVPGGDMPPRPTLEPDDIMTPAQIGRVLGVPASTVSTWIGRYNIESLGKIGRWDVYDYNELAVIEGKLRRKHESRAA
jgi:hypothetical protein